MVYLVILGIYIQSSYRLRVTLNFISKIKNINWIIKPHPNEIRNKVITSTKLIKKFYSQFTHIKLFPEEWYRNSSKNN